MQSVHSAFDKYIFEVLKEATDKGASDLHVEPSRGFIRIRARINGILQTLRTIQDPKYSERFLHQLKRICKFDMSKQGEPDDSRFSCEAIPFDCRANLTPSMFGDKTVLRFLERNKQFSLNSYPMPEGARADLRKILEKWQGLVLVTGPTGSGKTTLLYSAISDINKEENNVHTLEEPIEYEMAGVTQTAVSKEGLRFSKALTSLMRQDPDVILVGEIRDEETAHAAIHAASTGHLVFSTIHANSAKESIERLCGLGVERSIIEANLLYASAQRLVPRNCEHCLVSDEDSRPLVKAVFKRDCEPKRSVGCEACNHTGVKGRVLLFEYLVSQKDPHTQTKQLKKQSLLSESAFDFLKKGVINAQNACAFD